MLWTAVGGSMDQTACKPGSVPPTGARRSFLWPAHCWTVLATYPDASGRRGPVPDESGTRRPYSVLLQAGLAMPSRSPGPRWALTPPFHPYPTRERGGLLSVALSLGSPPAGVTRRLFAVEPGLSSPCPCGKSATARPSGPSPGWLVEAKRSRPGSLPGALGGPGGAGAPQAKVEY